MADGNLQGHLFEVIISFIVALLMIFFRDRLARLTIDFQNSAWGFHYGEREIIATKFVCVVVGCFVILLDILAVLGIIKFR
jgi:hypothetical protein